MKKKYFSCSLPFPPSVNGLFGQSGGRQRFKSKQYKAWLAACPDLVLAECGVIDFPVCVRYVFYFPDKRKRDLTNYIKAPEDYLVNQCVLEDDGSHIVQRVVIEYGGIDRDEPCVFVSIEELDG